MTQKQLTETLQLIISFIGLINCMPDNMCFETANLVYSSPLVVLNKTQMDTERKCRVACGDNPLCTAVSYKDLKCTQLGAANSSMSCDKPGTTVYAKTSTDCPTRTDLVGNMGNDPCVTGFFPNDVRLNQNGICPRNSKNYVVRGIDEFGNRITLDNDSMNVLSFNATRNMWKFYIASADFTRWLVSVACATATDACCGTVSLHPVQPSVAGQEAIQNNKNGTCLDTTKRLTFFGGKFKPNANPATFSAVESATMTITCQAGIWLMAYLDNHDGWQITNATCIP